MNSQDLEKIASQLSDLPHYPEGYVPDINKQYYRTKRMQQPMNSSTPPIRWIWIAASFLFLLISVVGMQFFSSSSKTPLENAAATNEIINSNSISTGEPELNLNQPEVVPQRNFIYTTGTKFSDSAFAVQHQCDSGISETSKIPLVVIASTDTSLPTKVSPKWVSQLKKQRKYSIISIAPEVNKSQPKSPNRNFEFFVFSDRGFELIKKLPKKEETIIYPNHEYNY